MFTGFISEFGCSYGIFRYIEHPMDLLVIKKKLDARSRKKAGVSYTLMSEMEADLNLMCDNCVAYNTGAPS
eukprot:COSAG05_NODE_716_length_7804_cov_2.669825_8_plen_71_part_00